MASQFLAPGKTIIGKNALITAKKVIAGLGTKALIVTGQSMICQGKMQLLTELLVEEGIAYVIDSAVTAEPTDVMIEDGKSMYLENGCDFVIGFGGGSPLDAAKAIGAMITNPGNIADYAGKNIENALPPLVAIPTTAGTGSETTQFTIIADTKNNIKMLLKGEKLIPDVAIIDSALTSGAPQSVTAAAGVDALTHAVEAYTSKKAFSLSDTFAMSAVKRIFTYLPKAYADGSDETAREEMAVAALEAGFAFNNASVTIVHGMSRPIGALFHVPHGISNAMLLSSCMNFACSGAVERFAALGRAIGIRESEDEKAAKGFISALEKICKTCEIPTLVEYGIDKDEFYAQIPKMAKDALDSGSPGNTRKAVTVEDMITLYEALY